MRDIRNIGMAGAVELEPRPGAPGARGSEVFAHAFEHGLLVRATGDTIAIGPPLVVSEEEIGAIAATLGDALRSVD